MISKNICLLFIVLFICLIPFCHDFVLLHEAVLLHCSIALVYNHIYKFPAVHTFWSDMLCIAYYILDLLNVCIYICDTLRDLVPFVQFKKREKHPWRSVTFSRLLLSRKLITWTKWVTLTILTKTSRKIDKYLLYAKSSLRKNFFTHLRHLLTFLLFVFIEKQLDISAK